MPDPRALEALNDLKHHWGSAYLIEFLGGRFVAQRRDSRESFSDPTPDGLLAKIRQDYQSRPVPRPAAPAAEG
jgi:hypothetical protein